MSKPPSIAIDISPLLVRNTGISYYTANLVSQLLGLKPDFRWRYFAVPERVATEVNVENPAGDFKTVVAPWFLPPRITSLLLQAPLAGLLAAEKFAGTNDLFHWTNFLICSQKHGKKVLTVHDVSFFLFPEFHPLKRRLTFKAFFPRSLEQADHIITDSDSTRRDLVEHFHVPADKMTTIHLGVDPSFAPVSEPQAAPILAEYGLRFGAYLLNTGTVEPRKNLLRLIQAYNLFRSNNSASLPLVLVGASGWLNQDLFEEIDKSPWKSDIKFLGYVAKTDLPSLYSGAVAFVYPSIYEGFGLPPLEAMACGTAVITANNSSLPEVVGDAAILVDAHNVDAIASAMLKVAGDATVRENLKQRGLARAKCFSWRRTAEQTLAVYEQALG
ncbi:MAG: glycosyltransferase family 1 protein [Deltaproteobacteria bacterium]|nr:glycosyltransferase family 1 protein [Deltaproteobacteria bacterium]